MPRLTNTFYKTPLAYGVVADVSPYSLQASELLELIEPYIKLCQMEDCNERAVRVAIFEAESMKRDGKDASEFRGLCEKHKQMGIWSNANTAWGWD